MIPDSGDHPKVRTPRTEHSDNLLRQSLADPSRLSLSRARESGKSPLSSQFGSGRNRTPSRSPPPLKVWDPLQAEQDKVVRKKEREDVYTHSHPSEEPILIVKKREMVTKYIKPQDEDHSGPPSSRIIKKTENTRVVDDDYNAVKQKMKDLLRNNAVETKVIEETLQGNAEQDEDLVAERIIKIEATEYLPKGFLELEPLLYKNEYEFLSPVDEKNFEEDQRRAKEMRRHQYQLRNQAKAREVIIYKIEHLKKRAAEILEEWFETNDEGMTDAEILGYARELQLDPRTFKLIHDTFMQDRAIFGRNSEELNKLIYQDHVQQRMGRPRDRDRDSRSIENRKSTSPAAVDEASSHLLENEAPQSQTPSFDVSTNENLFRSRQHGKERERTSAAGSLIDDRGYILDTDKVVFEKRPSPRYAHETAASSYRSHGPLSLSQQRAESRQRKLRAEEQRLRELEKQARDRLEAAVYAEMQAKKKHDAMHHRVKSSSGTALGEQSSPRGEAKAAEASREEYRRLSLLRQEAENEAIESRRLVEEAKQTVLLAEEEALKLLESAMEQTHDLKEKARAEGEEIKEKIIKEAEEERDRILRNAEQKAHMMESNDGQRDIAHKATGTQSREALATLTKDKDSRRSSLRNESETRNQIHKKSGSEREASLNASKVGEGRRVKDEVKKIHWADSSVKSVDTNNSQKQKIATSNKMEQEKLVTLPLQKQNTNSSSKEVAHGTRARGYADVDEIARKGEGNFNGGTHEETQGSKQQKVKEAGQTDPIEDDNIAQGSTSHRAVTSQRDEMKERKPNKQPGSNPATEALQKIISKSIKEPTNSKQAEADSHHSKDQRSNRRVGAENNQSNEDSSLTNPLHRSSDTLDNAKMPNKEQRPILDPKNGVRIAESEREIGSGRKDQQLDRSRDRSLLSENPMKKHPTEGLLPEVSPWQVDLEEEPQKKGESEAGGYNQIAPNNLQGKALKQARDSIGDDFQSEVLDQFSSNKKEVKPNQLSFKKASASAAVVQDNAKQVKHEDQATSGNKQRRNNRRGGDQNKQSAESAKQIVNSDHKPEDNSRFEELMKAEKARIEAELRKEYEDKIRKAREEAIEETMLKKDTGRKICRNQLWQNFLTYCRDELPHDQEFQKKMLRDTFMHFLQKKFASDEKYFDQLEEECNQIIWEDMTK